MPELGLEDSLVASYFPEDYVGTAVEVGAGDGVHMSTTIWMEQKGWKVLCVEPNPRFIPALRSNRSLVEQVACADGESDSSQFLLYDYPGAANHGVVGVLVPLTPRFKHTFLPSLGSPPTATQVKVRRLTSLLEQHEFTDLDFLSVDVDGLELQVLKGLDFTRWKPKVMLIENPFESDQLINFIMSQGYYRDHTRIGGNFNDLFVRDDG